MPPAALIICAAGAIKFFGKSGRPSLAKVGQNKNPENPYPEVSKSMIAVCISFAKAFAWDL